MEALWHDHRQGAAYEQPAAQRRHGLKLGLPDVHEEGQGTANHGAQEHESTHHQQVAQRRVLAAVIVHRVGVHAATLRSARRRAIHAQLGWQRVFVQ